MIKGGQKYNKTKKNKNPPYEKRTFKQVSVRVQVCQFWKISDKRSLAPQKHAKNSLFSQLLYFTVHAKKKEKKGAKVSDLVWNHVTRKDGRLIYFFFIFCWVRGKEARVLINIFPHTLLELVIKPPLLHFFSFLPKTTLLN